MRTHIVYWAVVPSGLLLDVTWHVGLDFVPFLVACSSWDRLGRHAELLEWILLDASFADPLPGGGELGLEPFADHEPFPGAACLQHGGLETVLHSSFRRIDRLRINGVLPLRLAGDVRCNVIILESPGTTNLCAVYVVYVVLI